MLNVSGPAVISNLTVTGNATIQGNLAVEGTLTVQTVTVTQNLTVNGRVLSQASEAPEVEALIAAGLDAEVAIEGTDTAGTITVTVQAGEISAENAGVTVTEPEELVAGELIKVLFNESYELQPRVVITPLNLESSRLSPFVDQDTDGFKLVIGESANDGVVYSFNYIVIGSGN
jgi:hypothetical protein